MNKVVALVALLGLLTSMKTFAITVTNESICKNGKDPFDNRMIWVFSLANKEAAPIVTISTASKCEGYNDDQAFADSRQLGDYALDGATLYLKSITISHYNSERHEVVRKKLYRKSDLLAAGCISVDRYNNAQPLSGNLNISADATLACKLH